MAFQWFTPDRPAAEIHIRVALINRGNALGTAEIVRVAGRPGGKGALCLNLACLQQRRSNT